MTTYSIAETKSGLFLVTVSYGEHCRTETTTKTFSEAIALVEQWEKEDRQEKEEEEEKNRAMKDALADYKPRLRVCPSPDTCEEEHNLCGDETHHYGCHCDTCTRYYYLKLK